MLVRKFVLIVLTTVRNVQASTIARNAIKGTTKTGIPKSALKILIAEKDAMPVINIQASVQVATSSST